MSRDKNPKSNLSRYGTGRYAIVQPPLLQEGVEAQNEEELFALRESGGLCFLARRPNVSPSRAFANQGKVQESQLVEGHWHQSTEVFW